MTDFPELWRELTEDMGLDVWGILRTLRISPVTLEGKLRRHQIPVPTMVYTLATEARRA